MPKPGKREVLENVQLSATFVRDTRDALAVALRAIKRHRNRIYDALSVSKVLLAGADLSGTFMSQVDLAGAYLTGANLEHAELSEVNLTDANLSHAFMKETRLIDATLKRANLTAANLLGARLNDASLARAIFEDAVLERVDFGTANMAGVKLHHARLASADLLGVQNLRPDAILMAHECGWGADLPERWSEDARAMVRSRAKEASGGRLLPEEIPPPAPPQFQPHSHFPDGRG